MNNNLTILIADDDADDRMLFVESVKEVDENIICKEAWNGQEALQYLQNNNNPLPDYIFLDYRMPRVDGKDCLIEIKKDARLKDIPVFIYTTSREVSESDDLLNNGAVHFISKPTDPREIYYLVSAALSSW